jgi:hypothetical protein
MDTLVCDTPVIPVIEHQSVFQIAKRGDPTYPDWAPAGLTAEQLEAWKEKVRNDPHWPRHMTSEEISAWQKRIIEGEARIATFTAPSPPVYHDSGLDDDCERGHQADANAQQILADAEARQPPWSLFPKASTFPDDFTGVSHFSGNLPVRTAAQVKLDCETCSRCLKPIIDGDPHWLTYASWIDPDKKRGEIAKPRAKFTSRRYCRSCYTAWVGPHKTRSIKRGATIGPRGSYVPHQNMMNAILNKLPGGCRGAILRHLITTRPPVMRRSDLVRAIDQLGKFRPEVIDKCVNGLKRDELVSACRGSHGQDPEVLVISEKAVCQYGIEVNCADGATAIFRLELYKPLPGGRQKRLPKTLDAAYSDQKCKWVVGCTIVGEKTDTMKDPQDAAIDEAFLIADSTRINPYYDAASDGGYKVDPVYDDPSMDDDLGGRSADACDWGDQQSRHVASIPPPDVLAELAENPAAQTGRFAIFLIGTTDHIANEWRPSLEPVSRPDFCVVCGYPRRAEGYRELETCLGCLRSAADKVEARDEDLSQVEAA